MGNNHQKKRTYIIHLISNIGCSYQELPLSCDGWLNGGDVKANRARWTWWWWWILLTLLNSTVDYHYQSLSSLVNWTYREGKPIQYITSMEVHAIKPRIIKHATIALAGGTILTNHWHITKRKSANSKTFGFLSWLCRRLKTFFPSMPNLYTK